MSPHINFDIWNEGPGAWRYSIARNGFQLAYSPEALPTAGAAMQGALEAMRALLNAARGDSGGEVLQ